MATATVSLTKPILIAVIDLDQFALAELIWQRLSASPAKVRWLFFPNDLGLLN